MEKPVIRILDKHSHWWSHEKHKQWAIQDKEGNWWLINGSEFPEKKIERKSKKMNCGTPPTFDFKSFFLSVFYAALLGTSLGINIFFLFIK